MQLVLRVQVGESTQHLQCDFGKYGLFCIGPLWVCLYEGDDIFERSSVHQLQDNFNSALLVVGSEEGHDEVAPR